MKMDTSDVMEIFVRPIGKENFKRYAYALRESIEINMILNLLHVQKDV